ncbi:MAG: hypothetical protein ABFD46_08200 [Armatimonadota bacterium]
MTKVKNIRPGIVIIADAGLKLAPGEVVELEKLTPQMSKAIDAGMLATVETQAEAKPEAKLKAKAPARTAVQKPEPKGEEQTGVTPPATGDAADSGSTEEADGSR